MAEPRQASSVVGVVDAQGVHTRHRAALPAPVSSREGVLERAAALLGSGLRKETLAREVGITVKSARRHLRAQAQRLREQGSHCRCGKPVWHEGGCQLWGPGADRRRAQRKEQLRLRERDALFVPASTAAAARDELYASIAAKVPRWMSPATRDDIIADVYLQVLEAAA